DFDFGNSPILRTLPGGKRVLVAGQKSGVLWGLDPDNEGKVLWQYRASKGGMLGGIEWGSAADDVNAYVPVSDVLAAPSEAGGVERGGGAPGGQPGDWRARLGGAAAEARMHDRPRLHRRPVGARVRDSRRGLLGFGRRTSARLLDGRRQGHLGLQYGEGLRD